MGRRTKIVFVGCCEWISQLFQSVCPECVRRDQTKVDALPAVATGPNFPISNGSLIACLERSILYAFDAVAKIQSQGIKSMSPKAEAVDEFQEHKDALMRDLVWTSGCRSWYVLASPFYNLFVCL